jgi:short-subunit dehydrogenase
MSDKVIVITGASGGIGAALAKQLGAEGHKLVLTARRETELKIVAGETGTEAITVVCDVRHRAQIENLKNKAIERFGRVDVWINNAGQGISRNILDLKENEFDEMICVNLKSAWYGMQIIVPHFQERKKGHLINISSFLSRVPFVTFRAAYSASKAALNILTANLRMDLAKDYPDIHISLVMPGVVTTDFFKNALGGTPQMTSPRRVMNAQTADEAAQAIVSIINDPQPEIYTNPALASVAIQYLQDVGAFEEKMRQQ